MVRATRSYLTYHGLGIEEKGVESIEFITSDLHYGHRDICGPKGFCDRRIRFQSTNEMDEYLIEAHNSVVSESDVTYHLGDFSLNISRERVLELLNLMNGQVQFIKGNHDSTDVINYIKANNYDLSVGFEKFVVHEVGTIVKKNKKIYYMTHFPLQLGERRKLRSLCGHTHEYAAEFPYALNIGVDSPELPHGHPFGVPLTLDVACELVEQKNTEWLTSD